MRRIVRLLRALPRLLEDAIRDALNARLHARAQAHLDAATTDWGDHEPSGYGPLGARSATNPREYTPVDGPLHRVVYSFEVHCLLPDDVPCTVKDMGDRLALAMAREPGHQVSHGTPDKPCKCE